MSLRVLRWMLVIAALVWGACAFFDWGAQRMALHAEGHELLADFWMPMDCVRGGYIRNDTCEISGWITQEELQKGLDPTPFWRPGTIFKTGWGDRVYPAFALLPFKFLPFTWWGGWCWSIGAGVLFLLSLVLCAQGKCWPLLLAASLPFIYNLERGNPVWLSAAAVAIFLAWWDHDVKWKRVVAAISLAVAAAFKVAPAVLGILYLREGFKGRGAQNIKFAILAGVLTLIFLIVPWVWMPDGFTGINAFLSNAHHHAQVVLRGAEFGFVQIWRTLRIVLGQDVKVPWSGMVMVARLSQCCGFALLIFGAKRRNYLLLVGGMLFAAGNMYYYAALYLLPVFVLERRWGKVSHLLWFALLCPLQLIVMGHPANGVIGNVALIGLIIGALKQEIWHTPQS